MSEDFVFVEGRDQSVSTTATDVFVQSLIDQVMLISYGEQGPAGPAIEETGVTAGEYLKVTVDVYGRVTGGSDPNHLILAGGTMTASDPALSITQTWNNAAVDFIGADTNITNTASGSGSVLQRWRVGGSTVALINKAGNVGIGLLGPSARLHTYATDGAAYLLAGSGTTKGFRVVSDANKTSFEGVDTTLTGSYQQLQIGGSIVTLAYNGTTEGARLNTSGNFLIGSTSNNARLYVVNPSGGVPDVLIQNSAASAWLSLIGTGTTGNFIDSDDHLIFRVGGSPTSRMWVDTSGNVGIGAISPGNRLYVLGSGDISRFSNGTVSLYGYSDSQGLGWFTGAGATGTGAYYNNTSNYQSLYTGGSERMRIDSSGNVGVGITAPTTYGKFSATAASPATYRFMHSGNSGSDSVILSLGSDNTGWFSAHATITATQLGGVSGYTFDLSASGTNSRVSLAATGAGSHLKFSTAGTERIRVIESGNTGFGTITPTSRLSVYNGNISVRNDNTSIPVSAGYFVDFSTPQQSAGISHASASPYSCLDLYAGGDPVNLGGWAGAIRFFAGATNAFGTEKMRLVGDTGALLIGTTSATAGYKLTIATGGIAFTGTQGTNATGAIDTQNYTMANGSYQYLNIFKAVGAGGGAVAQLFGGYFQGQTAASAYTTTEVAGIKVGAHIKGSGSTITGAYGIILEDQTVGGINYGLLSQITSGSGKYNIYASGTADNYFAGNLGIGAVSPSPKLYVSGTTWFTGSICLAGSVGPSSDTAVNIDRPGLTGSTTQRGLYVNPIFGTDGTLNLYGVYVQPRLAAGTQSISNLYNIYSGNWTVLPSGQTLGSYFGFYQGDLTGTGSTNIFGYYSAVTSGTNKWSFYSASTANNAFAGNVRIGSTVAPTVALDVTGSITSAGTDPVITVSSAGSGSSIVTGIFLTRQGGTSGLLSQAISFDVGGGGGGVSLYSSRLGGAGGNFIIATDTTGGVRTERMRIDSSGIVLVGTVSASGTNLLQVNSDALINTLTVGRGPGNKQDNAVLGYQALNNGGANVGSSVAIGYQALFTATAANADRQVAIGYQALYSNNDTTGAVNIGIGYLAGKAATGKSNLFIGGYCSYLRTTGDYNTFVGGSSGTNFSSVPTGNSNTALGASSLGSLTTGYANVSIGYSTGTLLATGACNVFVGEVAGSNATGNRNVFVGGGNTAGLYSAGQFQTTGDANTYIGSAAGGLMTTGSYNVILGGYTGNSGGLDMRALNNYIVLADGQANIRLVINSSGNVGIGTASPSVKLDVVGAIGSTGNYTITKAEPTISFINTGNDSWLIAAGGGGNISNGYFGIRNTTDGVTPFQIAPDAVANTVIVSSTGLAVTGTISSTSNATFGQILTNSEFSFSGTNTLAAPVRFTSGALAQPLIFYTGRFGVDAAEVARMSSTGVAVTGYTSATTGYLATGEVAGPRTSTAQLGQPSAGTSRLIAWGPDNATPGIFDVAVLSANAGVGSVQVASFSSTGLAVTGVLNTTGNVGIGVTQSAWGTNYKAIESAAASQFVVAGANVNGVGLYSNAYATNAGQFYKTTGGASYYSVTLSEHNWYTATSGTAGNPISFALQMQLSSTGLSVTGGIITTGNTNSLALTTGGGTVLDLRYVASSVNYLQIVPSAATGANVILRAAGTDTNVTLYYDSQGTGSHNFRTGNAGSNGNQFVISNTTSAVNYLNVSGSSAGSSPYVVVNGSDTNISLNVSSKGSGNFNVYTGGLGSLVAQFAHVASAVNYWYLYGNATGSFPVMSSNGSDTNINAGWSTKGTGSHLFYTNSTANLQASIIHTASAVNYLEMRGAATTGAPGIAARGSDTNINLSFDTKGTGSHVFTTGTLASTQVAINHTASATRYITLTGSNGGNPTIGVSAGDLAITPNLTVTGNISTAALLDLSGAAAGQIKFPATQNASADANTLDDYEEGTFTPTLVSSGGGTPTYSVQVGHYTKVGNRVLFNLRVKRATVSTMAAGNVTIGGLPFTSANVTDCVSACAISASNLAASVAYYDLQAVVGSNTTQITLYDYDGWGTGNRAVITTGDLNTTCEFEISGHYRI